MIDGVEGGSYNSTEDKSQDICPGAEPLYYFCVQDADLAEKEHDKGYFEDHADPEKQPDQYGDVVIYLYHRLGNIASEGEQKVQGWWQQDEVGEKDSADEQDEYQWQ